ncbi:hypothetical protein YC2023_099834 [Brassica napus]
MKNWLSWIWNQRPWLKVCNQLNPKIVGDYTTFRRLRRCEKESSSTSCKYGGVKKLETDTLSVLNSYVLNSSPHALSLANDK